MLHTVSYRGMGVFQEFEPTNLAAQIWIAARYMQAVSLLLGIVFIRRKLNTGATFAGFAVVTALLLISIFYWRNFPQVFVEGTGLTPFKDISEYIISFILLCAILLLIRYRREFSSSMVKLIVAAMAVNIASEMAFTLYVDAYGIFNSIGHLLKVLSFYFIYRAIIENGITKPYDLLFHNLKLREESLAQQAYELAQVNARLLTEISDHQKAEDALRQSEARYRSLFTNMTEAFALHEIILENGVPRDYRFIEVNPTFENFTGLAAEKVTGKTVKEVLPDIEDYWIKTYGKVALSGEPVDFENFSAELNRWYQVYAYSPLKGYFVTLFIDISERKNAEIERERLLGQIQRERDLLQIIMDSDTNAHLVYLDCDFNFVRVNATYARTCGYTPVEMIGKNHFILYPDKENEAIFASVRDTGVPAEYHDKPSQFPDQPERGITYWDWTLTPVKNSSDIVQGLVFALVSHELRTPLTVVTSALKTALDKQVSQEESQELLEIASYGVESLTGILDNMLELSRHQAGRLTLTKKSMKIAEIAEKTLKKLREQYPTRIATLDIPRELPPVIVDPGRLDRIIYNLVENAFKYSDEGSEVKISIEQDNNNLVIAVSDRGKGIAPKDQQKLFEPFERLETAGKAKGIGLGLVVCKHLIEAHGGRIWVESNPGEGSRFIFTVPL